MKAVRIRAANISILLVGFALETISLGKYFLPHCAVNVKWILNYFRRCLDAPAAASCFHVLVHQLSNAGSFLFGELFEEAFIQSPDAVVVDFAPVLVEVESEGVGQAVPWQFPSSKAGGALSTKVFNREQNFHRFVLRILPSKQMKAAQFAIDV